MSYKKTFYNDQWLKKFHKESFSENSDKNFATAEIYRENFSSNGFLPLYTFIYAQNLLRSKEH